MTKHQIEVAKLILKGLSNKEIGNLLYISEKTVKYHVTAIFKEFKIKRRSQLHQSFIPFQGSSVVSKILSLDEMLKRYCIECYQRNNNNLSKTAFELKTTRQRLHRILND